MFALRERRIHVTQEDFEMAVGKARLAPLNVLLLEAESVFLAISRSPLFSSLSLQMV